jgi:hypothetical protein
MLRNPMTNNEESEKIVLNWIKDKCTRLQCRACNEEEWQVNELLVCMIDPNHAPKTPAKTALPGPSFQFIPLCCKQCGYVMLFSAKAMGLTI